MTSATGGRHRAKRELNEGKVMSERTELGKIKSLRIGYGGYQDVMFGVTFDLGGTGWGVGDFWGFWSPQHIKHSENTKWTEADRQSAIYDAFAKVDAMLKQARKNDADDLIGLPVEVTFIGNSLKSWRLLTEVL